MISTVLDCAVPTCGGGRGAAGPGASRGARCSSGGPASGGRSGAAACSGATGSARSRASSSARGGPSCACSSGIGALSKALSALVPAAVPAVVAAAAPGAVPAAPAAVEVKRFLGQRWPQCREQMGAGNGARSGAAHLAVKSTRYQCHAPLHARRGASGMIQCRT